MQKYHFVKSVLNYIIFKIGEMKRAKRSFPLTFCSFLKYKVIDDIFSFA